jgi:hypothetical protein
MEQPALPENWCKRIFARLTMVYGRDFLSRWEGQDLGEVMADWSKELAGMQNAPHAIAYALENMDPNKPPNVLQFKALCHRAPSPPPPLALSRPDPTPEDKERVRKMLAEVRAKITGASA